MPLVMQEGRAEAALSLLQVLIVDQLVAIQRVRVHKGRVHLQGALEVPDAHVELLLQREAVPHHAPALGRELVNLDDLHMSETKLARQYH